MTAIPIIPQAGSSAEKTQEISPDTIQGFLQALRQEKVVDDSGGNEPAKIGSASPNDLCHIDKIKAYYNGDSLVIEAIDDDGGTNFYSLENNVFSVGANTLDNPENALELKPDNPSSGLNCNAPYDPHPIESWTSPQRIYDSLIWRAAEARIKSRKGSVDDESWAEIKKLESKIDKHGNAITREKALHLIEGERKKFEKWVGKDKMRLVRDKIESLPPNTELRRIYPIAAAH